MKKLEELGISPAPWGNDKDSGGWNIVRDAKGKYAATPDGDEETEAVSNANLIAAAPELYDALYDAWRRACFSPSRKCKECPYSGMYCNSWRAALAKASGESEVEK